MLWIWNNFIWLKVHYYTPVHLLCQSWFQLSEPPIILGRVHKLPPGIWNENKIIPHKSYHMHLKIVLIVLSWKSNFQLKSWFPWETLNAPFFQGLVIITSGLNPRNRGDNIGTKQTRNHNQFSSLKQWTWFQDTLNFESFEAFYQTLHFHFTYRISNGSGQKFR